MQWKSTNEREKRLMVRYGVRAETQERREESRVDTKRNWKGEKKVELKTKRGFLSTQKKTIKPIVGCHIKAKK